MTTDERPEPPLEADERATLAGFLDFQRATLAWKCAGLTDEQLRQRAVPPSSMSLIGLVRHLADVERSWFRRVFSKLDDPPLYYSDDEPDGEFDNVDTADVAEAFATWQLECAFAREAVAAAPSLEVTGSGTTRSYSLRWIMTHMIEEYARHNGHADLLRERIDGATGE
jgi:uncharacterized damage-inducible protein DinB